MQHLEEGMIHAWLDGALPPVEAEQVAKHAGECATCAAAVAEARGIIAGSARIVSALDDVPGGVIPSGGRATARAAGTSAWRRLRLTPGRAALAATILVAVSATLTLRSSDSPSATQKDAPVGVAVATPKSPTSVPPSVRVTLDSVKIPGPSVRAVNASPRQREVPASAPQPQVVAERSRATDALALRDSARELQKVRATVQEATAGASVAAAAPPAVSAMKANSVNAPRALDARDSVGTFEGCYRVSADSSVGSAELARGLPTRFILSRPSTDFRTAPRRLAEVRTDSSGSPVAWQQLSSTQANVTFGSGNARQVSLTLTAGSRVGVASSGDRTTTVRVIRSPCPP